MHPYEEQARKSVAKLINASPDEIVFTASGSESDNLAIIAAARAYKHKGKHIITSSIEHKAVLETFKFLENYEGFEVTYTKTNNIRNIFCACSKPSFLLTTVDNRF